MIICKTAPVASVLRARSRGNLPLLAVTHGQALSLVTSPDAGWDVGRRSRPSRDYWAPARTDGRDYDRLSQLHDRASRVNADAMRLFHKSPPPRPAPQRRVPRPWDPPQTEFPGIVPINTLQFGRSEQAALAITGMSACSNGFEISVTALIHPGATASTRRRQTAACSPTSPYQIRLQLADGRTVASGRSHGDSGPTRPMLRPCGGGGTSHYQHSRWWAWPLPPSGPLEFICHWPTPGTGETRVGIDAQLILDAARQSL